MELLIINGHDYSNYVMSGGYEWSREDLDSEKTKRVKTGKMRRDKITTKRNIPYTVFNMTREQLAQLDDDLSLDTFDATYLDLHGKQMTREFYCSSFKVPLSQILDNESDVWGQATFTLIEV